MWAGARLELSPRKLTTGLTCRRLISILYRLRLGHISTGRELPVEFTVRAVIESRTLVRPNFDRRFLTARLGSWLEYLAQEPQIQSGVKNNQPNDQKDKRE